MARQRQHRRMGSVLGLAMVGLAICLPGPFDGRVYAQTSQAMTPAEWQALARQVATTLDQISVASGDTAEDRAIWIPVLTQEYLQAFRQALAVGATKQQADSLATQHVFMLVKQLKAQAGTGPQKGGNSGCMTGRNGYTVCYRN